MIKESVYIKQSEKILKGFLKELEKNGFTFHIKKFLSKNVLSEKEHLKNFEKELKSIKFEAGKPIFDKIIHSQAKVAFKVPVNGIEITLFVEYLHEVGVPAFIGKPGVIPAKLLYIAELEKNKPLKENNSKDEKNEFKII